MIAEELLALLRCPLSQQPLRAATAAEIASLPGRLDAALVRADGRVAFPVRGGIPLLLPDEAIPLPEAAGEGNVPAASAGN